MSNLYFGQARLRTVWALVKSDLSPDRRPAKVSRCISFRCFRLVTRQKWRLSRVQFSANPGKAGMKKRKLTRRAALDILFADSEAFFSDARLGIPFLCRHWQWIQQECLTDLNAPTEAIRKGAFEGLTCLVNLRKLQPTIVIPILKELQTREPDASSILNMIYEFFPASRPSDWKSSFFCPTDRSREELEQMLQSPDKRTICVALWDAANYEEDWHWVQAECLKRLRASKDLREGALVALNYLALRRELEPVTVLDEINGIEESQWTSAVRENIYRFWKPQ